MAHRRGKGSSSGIACPAEAPSRRFFKVVHEDALKDKKMMIPPKFARNFGAEFPDEANLIVPSGDVWKVGLTKSQNNVLFDKNWLEFVQHYSIGHGHFLVFQYKGLSNFKVRIYDTTCCEIQYSPVETLNSTNTTPSPSCSLKNRIKVESTNEGDCSKRPTQSKQNQGQNKCGKRVASPETPILEHHSRPRSENGKAENAKMTNDIFATGFGKLFSISESARHSSRKFKSESPCFDVTLRDYNFTGNYVYVKSSFSKQHLIPKPEYIKLQLDDGREWRVQLNERRNKRMTLGKGWLAFSRENYLKSGDICYFELMKINELKVTIFRA